MCKRGYYLFNRLVRLGRDFSKIKLCGNTHLALQKASITEESKKKVRDDFKIRGNKDDKPVLLIMIGLQWGLIQDYSFWRKFFKGFPSDMYQVIIKWHPKVVSNSFSKNNRRCNWRYRLMSKHEKGLIELQALHDKGECESGNCSFCYFEDIESKEDWRRGE